MIAPQNKTAEINRRFIYAMRTIGKGHAAKEKFCGIMNFQPRVSKKSYNAAIKKLALCSNAVAQKSMQSAAREEIELHESPNICVSGDGTWKTRGHSSRVGVCCVIGDKTEKVIDREVLSSYCKACDSWKTRKGTPEYDTWKAGHEKDCYQQQWLSRKNRGCRHGSNFSAFKK